MEVTHGDAQIPIEVKEEEDQTSNILKSKVPI